MNQINSDARNRHPAARILTAPTKKAAPTTGAAFYPQLAGATPAR